MPTRRALVAVLLVFAACGGDEPSSPTPERTDAPAIAVDWANLDEHDDVVAEGWTITDCEGDALLLCFERDGAQAGSVELLIYDRDSFYSEVSLDYLAQDNEDSSERDRKSGCPDDFRFMRNPRRTTTVAGLEGIRSDWSVFTESNVEVERVVTYFGLDDERVIVFSAHGEAEGSCVGQERSSFRPEDLPQLLDVLDRVVAGSSLPQGTPSADTGL